MELLRGLLLGLGTLLRGLLHHRRLLARLRKERPNDTFHVATKAGRRLDPHVADGYRNLRPFIERSLQNLDTDAIELLHQVVVPELHARMSR